MDRHGPARLTAAATRPSPRRPAPEPCSGAGRRTVGRSGRTGAPGSVAARTDRGVIAVPGRRSAQQRTTATGDDGGERCAAG
ncbi:hypothetical protein KPATCC21470_4191 [Kitasatospora purpeofusca]